MFGHYPNMYWISKSYYERDHSNSFYKSYEDALEALAGPYSQMALFSFVEKFFAFPEYKCLISVAWRRSSSTPLSMSMRKRSPYHKIMNYAYLKRMDSGFMSRIARRLYGKVDAPCPVTVKGTSLGPSKVLGVYMIYTFGACVSLLLLAIEVCWMKISKIFFSHKGKIVDIELDLYNKDFEQVFTTFCLSYGPLPSQPYYQKMFSSELQNILSSLEQ